MTGRLQLIVGLGNPGPQYTETRHNAGFWLIDRLAREYGGSLRTEAKFKGEWGRVMIAGQSLWLLKPMTFMNLSGQAVVAAAGFYKIPTTAILVVHDELDLPPGAVRLKHGGGHGGHNGLRDTIRHLGKDFMRLRIGIGRPEHSTEVVGYVLRRAPQAEQQLLDDAIIDTCQEFPQIAKGELQKAMHALHSRKLPEINNETAASS